MTDSAKKLDYLIDGQAIKVRIYRKDGEMRAAFSGFEVAPGTVFNLRTVANLEYMFDEIARIMIADDV